MPFSTALGVKPAQVDSSRPAGKTAIIGYLFLAERWDRSDGEKGMPLSDRLCRFVSFIPERDVPDVRWTSEFIPSEKAPRSSETIPRVRSHRNRGIEEIPMMTEPEPDLERDLFTSFCAPRNSKGSPETADPRSAVDWVNRR